MKQTIIENQKRQLSRQELCSQEYSFFVIKLWSDFYSLLFRGSSVSAFISNSETGIHEGTFQRCVLMSGAEEDMSFGKR